MDSYLTWPPIEGDNDTDTGPVPLPPSTVRLTMEGDSAEIIAILREMAGRTPLPAGRRPGQKSLTAAEVQDIRARIKAGESITSVALLYKRSYDSILGVARGRSYRGVEDEPTGS